MASIAPTRKEAASGEIQTIGRLCARVPTGENAPTRSRLVHSIVDSSTMANKPPSNGYADKLLELNKRACDPNDPTIQRVNGPCSNCSVGVVWVDAAALPLFQPLRGLADDETDDGRVPITCMRCKNRGLHFRASAEHVAIEI